MHRRRQREHGEYPPKRKKLSKMVVFTMELFIATTFPMLVKISNFPFNLSTIFKFFSNISQNNCVISSKRAKI